MAVAGCSYAQRWLWTLQSMAAEPAEYNVGQAVLVHGSLEHDRLAAALSRLVERHEILRTCYREVDGVPVPVRHDRAEVRLETAAAPDLPAARRLAERLIRRPFELTSELPLRLAAIRLADAGTLLVLTAHHIAVDAWSLGILWGELAAGYDGRALPPAPAGYSQVAAEAPEPDAEQLAFWQRTLADSGWADLPTDHPRPAGRSGQGARLAVPVPAELAAGLRGLAADRGTTVFTVALAGVQAVLARWTGAELTSLGTVVSGRGDPELDSVVGYFVNTVVLRNRVRPGQTGAELIDSVTDIALDAYSHAEIPFAELVNRFEPVHDASRSPLFTVMATVQSEATAEFRPAGLATEPVPLDSRTEKFDLSIMLTERDDRLALELSYATDLFEPATAARLGRQLVAGWQQLCRQPDRPVAELELLDRPELAELRRAGTGRPAPLADRPIADLVAELAARQPDAPAVLFGRSTMSYAELDDRAARVAGWLRQRGVRRGNRVGIRVGRQPSLLVGLLGILKAGACYVPLEPNAPAERAQLVLADSGAEVVLTDAELAAAQSPDGPATHRPAGPDELAYLMYTSGSTGRPKGVLVSQRGVLNLSSDLIDRVGLGPSDVVAAVAPYSFDMSVPELITPLLAGAAIRLVPREAAYDASALAAELAGVTFAQLTPTHWQLLLDAGWADPRLRAGCGAEAFPPALAGRLAGWVATLWNFYGPTETTVWSTAAELAEPAPDRPVPIGRPMRNTHLLVLDERWRPVPLGVPGELYIGGAGLADGYSNAPGLTAARFVPDPYRAGQRLYRTGDVVRMLPDGQLEFRGRADDQIKLHGHRIELAEVEAALNRHPAVARSAAAVRGTGAGQRLVGFVALREEVELATIRQFARRLLPHYMVPAALHRLETIPLSSNGKLDRRQLPAEVAGPDQRSRQLADDAERTVAEAFAEVLGAADLGPDDDFFALGGHSLNGMQVIARLRRHDPALGMQQLFEFPTVAALADQLRLGSSSAPVPSPATAAEGGAGPVLSPAQQRLWLLDRLSPEPGGYNVQRVLRLRGRLDPDRLEWALRQLQQRHAVLRCRFPAERGVPRLVSDDRPVELRRSSVAGRSGPPLAAGMRLAQHDIDSRFDLEHGPVWRARLIELAADDRLLVLVFHHIVIDGGSVAVLWSDLERLCRGESLPPAPQYADFAASSGQQRDGLRFWQAELRELPDAEVPGDRPRPLRRSGQGAVHRFELPAATVRAAADFARATGTTWYATTLAGFAATMARYSGADEVALGTPVSGRDRAEHADCVGCFVNTIVLRLDCRAAADFAGLARVAGQAVTRTFPYRNVPFQEVVDALDPVRDLSRNPLFQAMFAVSEEERVSLPGVRAELLDCEVTTSKFDLGLELTRTGMCTLTYDPALFDHATMVGFGAVFAELLAEGTRQPRRPLPELAAVAVPEPATEQPVPSLLERFERSVADFPDRIAVQSAGRRLSYLELDRLVDRLAGQLAARDVRVGTVVALPMPAGIDLLAAMLAVARLGAVFMPVDPADPPARRSGQLAAAGAGLEFVVAGAGAGDAGLTGRPALPAGRLAGVYFTSGSTGAPKAVWETAAGIDNYLRYLEEGIGLEADDVVLQLAPPTFDASVRDTFGALCFGGRTVLLRDDERRDAYRVLETIERCGVTAILSTVPSMLRALVRAARGATSELRLIMVSGEVLDAQLADQVAQWAPKARLVNQYGPTECTMTSTYHEVAAADVLAGAIPIGRPIRGARCYLVGRHGELLPDGAPGELCLAGAGLSWGYHRPGLTAGRFVPDPFGPPGSRMYRTGDLAHRRHDGVLIYHGRTDSQLKVRGVRIEPAEVEAVLSSCPGVQASAVAVHDGVLVGYLVGDGWSRAAIRQALADSLPAVLHPGRLQSIARLPMTSSGKLDRRQLPAPVDRPAGDLAAARDRAELMLMQAWQQVLNLPAVGVHDDFFEVGGNSLKAVELIELLRERHGLELPLHALFVNPTIDKLSSALPEPAAESGLAVPLASGPPDARPLFLIHPQSGEVCCYLDLVRALRVNRPVYGIEAVGYSAGQPPLDRVEAMAERYLAEVRRIAPDGPYLLAGWSFGGNVAFEMACQLERAGQQVGFLGVIDARAFGEDAQEDWYLAKDDVARYGLVAGLIGPSADQLAELDESSLFGILLGHARNQGMVSDRADSATMRRMVEVFSANGRAAERYRSTAVLQAGIDLIRATERHPTLTNPRVSRSAWQRRTRGALTVHDVPGTHHDLIYAEHAPEVAALLSRELERTGLGVQHRIERS